MINNKIIVQVKAYSSLSMLENLRNNNIVVYNFKKNSDYLYTLSIDIFNEKKILKLYKDAKVINRVGLLSRFRNLLMYRITLVALIVSLTFFFLLNSRISSININGENKTMNNQIALKTNEYGLKKYSEKPNFNELKTIENNLKTEFRNEIDFVEVTLKGTVVNINYKMRKEVVTIPESDTSLYAKKNGLIQYYVLTSGVKMIEEGQYVRQGDLLISDSILDTQGNAIFIGALGEVYAKTWNIVETNSTLNDEGEAFIKCLEEAKSVMCKGFNEKEKIIKEKVLKFNKTNNKYVLSIHFTCLENIGITN